MECTYNAKVQLDLPIYWYYILLQISKIVEDCY